MERQGRLHVSPDALRHEARVLGAIPHPAGYGAARAVLALGDAVAGAESHSATERFSDRTTDAFSLLDERRAELARSLGRAAAAYAAQETRVERGMRPGP